MATHGNATSQTHLSYCLHRRHNLAATLISCWSAILWSIVIITVKNLLISFSYLNSEAKMTCDLTSLNWLSSLDVADRTVAGTVPQLTSTPARGYATSISNSGGTSLKWNQHAAAEIQLDSRNSEMLNGAVIQPVPRPACSYSCLIAMALKASSAGSLPVNEIYRFIEWVK